MKINWKILGIALGVVAFFLVLSYGFMPQLLEGKIVNQADISVPSGHRSTLLTFFFASAVMPTISITSTINTVFLII